MRELMAVLKALADENRVRILASLQQRDLCVCQIVELLGLAYSTVSKHISVLKQARLVESRKEGRWIFCRLAGPDATPEASEITCLVTQFLARDPRVRDDARKLKEILKIDPEVLCRKQSACKC